MSNTDDYYRINDLNEKPLAHLVSDGGYCGILRTIGCPAFRSLTPSARMYA